MFATHSLRSLGVSDYILTLKFCYQICSVPYVSTSLEAYSTRLVISIDLALQLFIHFCKCQFLAFDSLYGCKLYNLGIALLSVRFHRFIGFYYSTQFYCSQKTTLHRPGSVSVSSNRLTTLTTSTSLFFNITSSPTDKVFTVFMPFGV